MLTDGVLDGARSAMTQTVWDADGDVRKALRSITGDPQLGTPVLARSARHGQPAQGLAPRPAARVRAAGRGRPVRSRRRSERALGPGTRPWHVVAAGRWLV